MDSRLRQIIRQKLEEPGEPLTPEEEIEKKKMEQEAAAPAAASDEPSFLGKLRNKAMSFFEEPKTAQPLSPIAPRKKDQESPAKASESIPKMSSSASSSVSSKGPTENYKPQPMKDIHKQVSEFRSDMDPEVQSKFDAEYRELEGMRQQAIEGYRADRKAADWGRVAEMLGRAMLKAAAGYAGLKSGVDLSSAVDSGEKWDWKQDYDNMKEDLRAKLEGVSSKESRTGKKEERAVTAAERATEAGRREMSSKENDERQRLMNADRAALESKSQSRRDAQDQAKEDRFYATKNIEAVENELKALDRVKSGVSKKSKLSRDALTTDLAGLGIELDKIPKAKGILWGTKGSDSVDSGELGRVLAAHGEKLRARRDKLLGADSISPKEATSSAVEEERVDSKTGKVAIFKDKKFVRWK